MYNKMKCFSLLKKVCLVFFLLFVNVLMGFFTKTGMSLGLTFFEKLGQIFTWQNILIAILAGVIAYWIEDN